MEILKLLKKSFFFFSYPKFKMKIFLRNKNVFIIFQDELNICIILNAHILNFFDLTNLTNLN